jgi:hypothetical protein
MEHFTRISDQGRARAELHIDEVPALRLPRHDARVAAVFD